MDTIPGDTIDRVRPYADSLCEAARRSSSMIWTARRRVVDGAPPVGHSSCARSYARMERRRRAAAAIIEVNSPTRDGDAAEPAGAFVARMGPPSGRRRVGGFPSYE